MGKMDCLSIEKSFLLFPRVKLTCKIRAMVWGSTLVSQQAMDWNITVNHSATSMNYGILLQGFGGIFAVPLIEAYGRSVSWFNLMFACCIKKMVYFTYDKVDLKFNQLIS